MDLEQQYDVSNSDSEFEDSDDSEKDPTFDVLEETRSSLSKLSIKKHTSKDMSARCNVANAMEECIEEEQVLEKIVPELNEKDQKSYETVQDIIKAGQIEKLKVDQCKVYLRKHGLRLTGSKDILIQRIKEHTDIVGGRGEEKYPPSSFLLNCKGDACTGDVVMFEQNVYEMFNIASRSATGPPCGTRIVAGRIVKESYGAKKQQHTFTVEVLWSKGEKPLPPLHPLLIKGRNLYKLKTLRQKWNNEAERQKILSEKHARGSVARSNREARVQQKEMRKTEKENRVSKDYNRKKEAENKGRMPHPMLAHQNNTVQMKSLHSLLSNTEKRKDQPQVVVVGEGGRNDITVSRENWPEVRPTQRQPLTNVNLNSHHSSYRERGFGNGIFPNPPTSPLRMHSSNVNLNDHPSSNRDQGFGNGILPSPPTSPLRMHNSNTDLPMWRGTNNGGHTNSYNSNTHVPIWRGSSNNGGYSNFNTGHGYNNTYTQSQNMNYRSPQRNVHGEARNGWCNGGGAKLPFQGQCEEQKKFCRFYAQGRCYYGHTCRYLHVDYVPF